MRRINYPLYLFTQLTWGIIQNIVGFFIYIFLILINPRRLRFRFNGAFVIKWNLASSASIGMFIFLGRVNRYNFTKVLVHEYGHTIQSCILGPFYFLVIGIPSFTWAHRKKYVINRSRGKYLYSDFYPEKWANHLGGKYTNMKPIDY